MKKSYLFGLFALISAWQMNAQVLNQNAGWPNAAWTVTGTYNPDPLAFEANPTTTANFAFDDDDAGQTSIDNIAAESPVINLTAAVAAGETKVRVSAPHTYRVLGGYLRFEYWNADAAAWQPWGANLAGNNTTVNNNFCTPAKTLYTSSDLDVAAFTPTQLSGFRYRIAFDDLNWEWGFCFDSPTIISIPSPCLTGTNYPTGVLTITNSCDGVTPTLIAPDSHAGDYYLMNVTAGQTYKYTSSVATDFYTLSTDNGLTAVASGPQPLTWVSTVTGVLRVHLNTNIACGTQETDRTTTVICGTACLNGVLFPADTYTPATCDGTTVNQIVDNAYAGEYSNVNVFSTNSYTFSSSVATDYITIATADGTTALAVGTGSVSYTPTANGVIRVYFHTDSSCGTENEDRIKSVVCTTSVALPNCAINYSPADGSTTAPAFADIILSWDAPTTGDAPTSYNVYGGINPTALTLFGNITTTSFNAGPVNQYGFVGYWQVVPVNAAGEAVGCPVLMFTTEAQPTDTPDYVNLQFPATITITQGGSDTVYGQVYEAGLTDVAPNIVGQAPGILAWVGISPEGDNSNPDTWTNWTPATWNAGSVGNNDEYQLTIGANLAPGTYYYATRFTLNGGPFVYGGLGNFWNATTNPSGVLTITPPPAPNNDECLAAIALTPGVDFAANPLTTTNIGATTDALVPSCQANIASNVWYSVVVPASGSITIETQANGGMTDSVVVAYSGTCDGTLTPVGCDDDGGPAGANNLMSILSLTGQTPGSTLLISVWRYSFAGGGTNGSFVISAYDASLSNASFDDASFVAYPNPVKDMLNLSYSQNISKVQVINLVGQEVITNSLNATQGQIDMSNLPVGTYLVRVTSDEQVKTIKVIKE